MKKGKLICFVGIDGCGKSSHINKIVNDLNNKKVPCKIVRCGAHVRVFTFPLYVIAKLIGIVPDYNESKRYIHTSKYPDVYKNKVICTLWPWAVFFDSCLMELIRIKVPLRTHEYVFSDRYVYDVLVEIMVVTRDLDFCNTTIGKLFLRLSNASTIIYLNTDEKEAFKRKTDIPDLEFLRIRKKMYNIVLAQQKVIIFDTTESFENAHKMINEALGI